MLFALSICHHIPIVEFCNLEFLMKPFFFFSFFLIIEILGSIRCALALKLCGGARTHEISKAHKSFGEIPPGVKVIQIIEFFNGDPKSNLGKLKN